MSLTMRKCRPVFLILCKFSYLVSCYSFIRQGLFNSSVPCFFWSSSFPCFLYFYLENLPYPSALLYSVHISPPTHLSFFYDFCYEFYLFLISSFLIPSNLVTPWTFLKHLISAICILLFIYLLL